MLMTLKRDYDKKACSSPEKVFDIFKSILEFEHPTDQDKEHFWIIGVTSKNIIKYIDLCHLGCLDGVQVGIRETFRMAIYQGVSGIIIAHNHPSGMPEPSEADIGLTDRIITASKILDIRLLDHIIVGSNKYYSFRERKEGMFI